MSVENKEDARFGEYELAKILPKGSMITVDHSTRFVSLLKDGHLVEGIGFSGAEFDLFVALLESYPDYCPREEILSVLTHKPIERCRRAIIAAADGGNVNPVMSKAINSLSRTRIKLLIFGIYIATVQETGYILTPVKSHIKAGLKNKF